MADKPKTPKRPKPLPPEPPMSNTWPAGVVPPRPLTAINNPGKPFA